MIATETPAVAPRIVRKIIWALFGAQALYSGASIATFALLGLIVESLTDNGALVGVPATLVIVGRAISAYPLGWLMDRFGRRAGLTIGYFTGVVASALILYAILTASIGLFIAMALLLGMSRAAGEQSRYVAADIGPASARAKAIGTVVFAGTLGSIGGPLLIGPSSEIARSYGINLYAGPWVVSFFLSIASAAIVYLFLRPEPNDLVRKVHAGEGEESLGRLFGNPLVLLAILGLIIGQAVMTMIMVITPVHMIHNDHTLAGVAWVTMAHTFGMYAPSSFSGPLIDRIGALPALVLGGVLLLVSAVLAPVSNEMTWLIVALFLLGLAWNICFIGGSALFSSAIGGARRGRAQGVSEATVAIASGLGSILTGVLYAGGGLMAVCVVGGILSIILVVAAAWGVSTRRLASQPA